MLMIDVMYSVFIFSNDPTTISEDYHNEFRNSQHQARTLYNKQITDKYNFSIFQNINHKTRSF